MLVVIIGFKYDKSEPIGWTFCDSGTNLDDLKASFFGHCVIIKSCEVVGMEILSKLQKIDASLFVYVYK